MNGLFQDVRYALRQLRNNPGFTAVAVITLALGIGANTAIFRVMNAALLRYLPVPNPQQLVYLERQSGQMPVAAEATGISGFSFNYATFEQLRTMHGVFSDLMAFVPLSADPVSVRFGKEAEEAAGQLVSGNFFSGLGVRAARGHMFTPDDESRHSQSVVLSYNYWTRRFSRDPSIVGQTLYIKSLPFTIVGVATRDFIGVEPDGSATDFWIPFQTASNLRPWGGGDLYHSPKWWFLMMIGRLRPGVSRQQAIAQLNPQFQRAAYEGIGPPKTDERLPNLSFFATGGIEKLRQTNNTQFAILMSMVGLILVMACLNVAMLLMARNAFRQHDLSLRVALGAGRLRLFRQLLAETFLLTAAGTLLAWILASSTTSVLATWAKIEIPVPLDRVVLGFTLAIAVLITFILGLAPFPRAFGSELPVALKASGVSTILGGRRFRGGHFMVGGQIAASLVLLVGTMLLVRTLRNLQTANLGFRSSGLLVFGVTPPQTLHTRAEDVGFYRALIGQLRTLPDVESVTTMGNRIGSGWMNDTSVKVDGTSPGGSNQIVWNDAGPDFCHALGIALLEGRDLTDVDAAAPVAIVNRTFAEHYFNGQNALGHKIQLSGLPPMTIVGIAADSRYTGVREDPAPTAYVAYSPGSGTMTIAVRAYRNPLDLLPAVRKVVAGFSPDIALIQPTTMEAQFEDSYSDEQMFARMASLFGLLACLLVATGVFGMLGYKVAERTAEIGLRMALGAQPAQILRAVLQEGLLICAIGVTLGVPFALISVRVLRSKLYHISPFDPVSFVAAICGLVLVAVSAGYLPARRAAKVDPMVALRYE
jgi:predicted permease